MKLYIILLTEIFDELLVAVALVATQMEVAVGSLNAVACCQENAQQGDAVGSPAEGYDMQTFTGQ